MIFLTNEYCGGTVPAGNADNVTFHTSQDGGSGFLLLSFAEDDQGGLLLLGCFDFLAGQATGDGLNEVADGTFVLAE